MCIRDRCYNKWRWVFRALDELQGGKPEKAIRLCLFSRLSYCEGLKILSLKVVIEKFLCLWERTKDDDYAVRFIRRYADHFPDQIEDMQMAMMVLLFKENEMTAKLLQFLALHQRKNFAGLLLAELKVNLKVLFSQFLLAPDKGPMQSPFSSIN
eukprot:TRINITY_DN2326_c0_g1_i5.p2 TRINITY_DN2326_c0_g1~~TRINITY_DN2326_c0_g1_i5.p2  ORF type:complete len:154 (+),score=18.45 TRINITY_DN2326_c0_g1_i5:52-513(+)